MNVSPEVEVEDDIVDDNDVIDDEIPQGCELEGMLLLAEAEDDEHQIEPHLDVRLETELDDY